WYCVPLFCFFFFQAEDGIRDRNVTGVQTCALPISGFLPESVRRPVVEACERALDGLLTGNVVVMADTIVQDVIRPLLTPVFSLVLFFLCFAGLRMLISLLVTVLGLVNHLPLVGTVNHLLGVPVGALAGLADVFLLLCVVWALMVITGGNLPGLNEA